MATGAPAVDLNQHGLTGSWYEPVKSGQGTELEVFPDSLDAGTGLAFMSWFTYDTVIGGAESQRWYTALGSVATGQPNASLTIYQNTGGNFNLPPMTVGQLVGTATLTFDSCSGGQLSYTFTDGTGRAGVIPLTRLTQNVTCSLASPYPTNADFAFSGNWYDPATSGQGLSVEVNPNSSVLFAAWYTYAPSGATAGAAGQRWYTAQGPFASGSRAIPLTIYETTGGVFDKPTPPSQTTVPVGSAIMAFHSCSAALFSYNFTGGSSSGLSGKIALSRIGPVPPGCVAPPPIIYEFATTDFPAATDTQIYGIVDSSDGAELVGIFDDNTCPDSCPFRLSLTAGGSTFTSLPSLPGFASTQAVGINAAGTIVGGAFDAGGNESAFILDRNGRFTVFSNPGWPNTEARGISSTGGLVIGRSVVNDAAGNHLSAVGFIYEPEQKTFTPILPGVGVDVVAQGINAVGQVVGHVLMPDGSRFGWLRQSNGDITLFQVDGLATIARGINDSGQITGWVAAFPIPGQSRGFVTTLVGAPGFEAVSIPDAELLEYPGATQTNPEGITNTGEVAGLWSSDGLQTSHGFIATPR